MVEWWNSCGSKHVDCGASLIPSSFCPLLKTKVNPFSDDTRDVHSFSCKAATSLLAIDSKPVFCVHVKQYPYPHHT